MRETVLGAELGDGSLDGTGHDIDRVPAVRKAAAALGGYLEEARSVLLRGRRERGRSDAGRAAFSAALRT